MSLCAVKRSEAKGMSNGYELGLSSLLSPLHSLACCEAEGAIPENRHGQGSRRFTQTLNQRTGRHTEIESRACGASSHPLQLRVHGDGNPPIFTDDMQWYR